MSRSETRTGKELDLNSILNSDTPPQPEETEDNQLEDTGAEVDETTDEVDPNTAEGAESEDTEHSESEAPDLETLQKELENYKNRYSNAEKLIGKHSQELHQLREFYNSQTAQQSQTEDPATNEKFLDDFVKNPQQALIQELQKREESINNERQQQEQWVSQNTQQVYGAVPNFDELKNDILDVAKEDGIETPTLEMLQQTVNTDPLLAIQYAKRASLKKEIETIRNKGKQTIKQIASNSKKTPTIKGNTPVSKSSKELTDSQIRGMSKDEIRQRLTDLGFYK